MKQKNNVIFLKIKNTQLTDLADYEKQINRFNRVFRYLEKRKGIEFCDVKVGLSGTDYVDGKITIALYY
jgi:phosphoribosylaminoimidazole-succinocarboxamide synthase